MSNETILDALPDVIAKAENLPSPPTVATEVLVLTSRDDVTIEKLAQVVSHDPALSLKILKLANSPFFRRSEEITTLEQAALWLGMKTLKLMSLSFSLTQTLPRGGSSGGFRYDDYWMRSMTLAVAGRSLSRLTGDGRDDEAFLCGLLGRIGQIVMAQCLPDRYPSIINVAGDSLPPAWLEHDHLGFDFHQVGSTLLKMWQLPELIYQTVRFWGNPENVPETVPESTQRLIRIMHIADYTSAVICEQDKGGPLKKLHDLATGYFGLSSDEVDRCILSMEQDIAEAAKLLNMEIEGESHEAIMDRARTQLMHFSLSNAMDLQQTERRAQALEREKETLVGLAETDRLTGISNRARFDGALSEIVDARLMSGGEGALGILMIDIDHFKKFNDTYGHLSGDEVLKLVARTLKDSVRTTDLPARYGGEEFVVIVPNASLDDLKLIGERIRNAVAQETFVHADDHLSINVSVGGARVDRIKEPGDGMTLVAKADACLYRAKKLGRNRVICTSIDTVEESR